MIFLVQIILICVLMLILAALYIDERQKRSAKIAAGKLTEIWDGAERRRFLRVNTGMPVKYTIPAGSKNHNPTKSKNISAGGICITINEKLPPKSLLDLEIDLPDSAKPLVVRGEVMWTKEETGDANAQGIRRFSVGVEFKEILSRDPKRLVKFIEEAQKTAGGKD